MESPTLSSPNFLSFLHRISGPTVKIKIGSSPHEPKVSKELLCEKSPYFAAMFTGRFREKTNNAVTMAEIEGVVSVQSVSMFLEWLYLDKINDDPAQAQEERISALIEFARFADMCMVPQELFVMIKCSLQHVIESPGPGSEQDDLDFRLHCVTRDHIDSTMHLPMGNPVRKLMTRACVRNFLGPNEFKFEEETTTIGNFAADLLSTVRDTLKGATFAYGTIYYVDPFDYTQAILFCQDQTRYKR